MRRLTAFSGLMVLFFMFGLLVGPLGAQETGGEPGRAASPSDQIQTAARRLFKGLADADVAAVAQNTASRYIRKLSAKKLRPPLTGPKVKASFDGNVTVVRSSDNDAVVEAQIFSPETTDVPTPEITRVRIYMVKEGGDWKASAADKKEAQEDQDLNGGWYHAASFTFCPKKGLIFVPNHFSREIKCETVAECVRF